MMTPAEYDITIFEGADYDRIDTWKDDAGNPVDLTNFTVASQVRKGSENADSKDIGQFITLGGVAGTITHAIPASFTLDWGYSNGVYDLELTDTSDSKIYKLLYGNVKIVPEVTK